MQFFDLSRQFNLNDILSPSQTLNDLSDQKWFLAKIRVDHDCLIDSETIEGQAVIQSNENIQVELEWIIHDSGHELQVLFKGIETEINHQTFVVVKGAKLVNETDTIISSQALVLWIDGTLLPLLPNIRQDIKSHLNLWDYVEYDS